MQIIILFHVFEHCKSILIGWNRLVRFGFSHAFVNQFEKMDRSKPSANHKDIICGDAFEPTEVLQELSRLRHIPLDIIRNKQEDAHELLCQLLNEIHDEICLILYQSPGNKNGKTKDIHGRINRVCLEESTSSSDLSALTTDLQLNTEEKAEDWLQVGKRNRTHVLRTVNKRNQRSSSFHSDLFRMKFVKVLSLISSLVNSDPQYTVLEIKNPSHKNLSLLYRSISKYINNSLDFIDLRPSRIQKS